LLISLCSACGYAEDPADLKEVIRVMQSRIDALEKKVAEQGEYISKQQKESVLQKETIQTYESRLSKFEEKPVPAEPPHFFDGFVFGLGGTLVAQGTDNANDASDGDQLKDSRTDALYSIDLTLARAFEGTGGNAFLHLEAGEGSGLEDDLVLYSNVNRDAADNGGDVTVTELWYEQKLFGENVAVSFGKLDPTILFDQSAVAHDETRQFLGRIFRNSPVVEFPDNTAGVRVAALPFEWLELGYGYFDGDNDWERIGDDGFNMGQAHLKTDFFGAAGNYRFYGWKNNADHTKWSDPAAVEEASYGFGLSFDQKLAQNITGFCRYGWQDPDVYNPNLATTDGQNFSLEESWSAGLEFGGAPWKREKDVLALALGQVFPSGEYKRFGSSTVLTPKAKPEGHFELYYRIQVNEHLCVSPDLQYIWNPFGGDIPEDTESIWVGGLRAQINF